MLRQRKLQLLYGVVMLLFLGLIYGWSIFVTPLEAEFLWQRAQTSLVFTFSMSFFCIGGFLSGLLLRVRSYRFVLRAAALCLLAGFFAASRVQSLWGIYLSYGVLCGLGVGLGYNAIMGTAIKWFPEKPGFCSGTLLLGFGIGALLLGTGAGILITAFGWRNTFLLFAVVFSLVLLAGAQLLRLPTVEQTAALPCRSRQENAGSVQDASFAPREMVRRPSFWLLFFWGLLFCAIGLSVIGHAVPIALEVGAAAFAPIASGLISVCNGLSRPLFGSVFDRLGRRKTMLLHSILFFSSIPLLYGAAQLHSVVLLVAGFALIGFGYGGIPAITASAANRMYGERHYAINFSLINMNILPASLLGPTVAGSMQMAFGSYAPLFPVLLAFCVPPLIAAALLKKV